jgi:transcriptional regulator with XRE-family HTH domain
MLAKFDSEKLRAARKHKKLSQMHLAELCDSSDRYIRDLERGTKENPSAALVCLMSKVLEVPMEELVKIEKEEGQEQ